MKLLELMTLEEKVQLLHGVSTPYVGAQAAIPRLNIPALYMNDGPQGFRDQSISGAEKGE